MSRHFSICNSTASSGTTPTPQIKSIISQACVFRTRASLSVSAGNDDDGVARGDDATVASSETPSGPSEASSAPSELTPEGFEPRSSTVSSTPLAVPGGASASPRTKPRAMSVCTICKLASAIFGDLLRSARRVGFRISSTFAGSRN